MLRRLLHLFEGSTGQCKVDEKNVFRTYVDDLLKTCLHRLVAFFSQPKRHYSQGNLVFVPLCFSKMCTAS